jgi:hypothetical protein
MNQEELTRTFHRIQEAKNAELPAVLSTLLPKLIPLTNQEPIRNEVIKILTEALRRGKLANTTLKLDTFLESLNVKNAPFGCNFAIAFMDALSDLNCITDVNTESVAGLVENLISFEVFSYQSNSLCYYILLNCSMFFESLAKLKDSAAQLKAAEIMSDFFLDVLLLQGSDLGKTTVPAGLSQNRVNRIISKKKNLDALLLLQWKRQVLDAIIQSFSLSKLPQVSEYNILFALAACQDQNSDIQSMGKKILNILKEALLLLPEADGVGACNKILELLLRFSFPMTATEPTLYLKDRTTLSKELQISILDYSIKNHEWLFISTKPFQILFEIFSYLSTSATLKYSSSELNDRVMKMISELLYITLKKFLSPAPLGLASQNASAGVVKKIQLDLVEFRFFQEQVHSNLPKFLQHMKAILSQFAYNDNRNSNANNSQSSIILDLKNSCYDILSLFLSSFSDSFQIFVQEIELVILLFTIASTDNSIGATSLFKLLQEILEKWDNNSKY